MEKNFQNLTLFELFIDYLKKHGVKSSQIIHINLEDADYDFKDYKELYSFISEKLNTNDKFYVFLDEVQNVLERELKSLQKTDDYYPKILLTLDMDLEADYDGITKMNVVDWLLKE